MNQNIDQALQKIELSKKAISEAELILADLLGKDIVEKVNEVIPVEETTPRTDLVCLVIFNARSMTTDQTKNQGNINKQLQISLVQTILIAQIKNKDTQES